MIFYSTDDGLHKHWASALVQNDAKWVKSFDELCSLAIGGSVAWIDNHAKDMPDWNRPVWKTLIRESGCKVILCDSAPNDDQAIAALDGGCAAYCHAYAQAIVLNNVLQVVQAGQVWVGSNLMQRLIRVASHARGVLPTGMDDWKHGLTPREVEVATLAANGASNQLIARECDVSERTVKAHLSAIFQKMNVTDRLQVALRVHGIS